MKSGVNPIAMAEFCLALVKGGIDRRDLCQAVGINRNTVSRWLQMYYDRKMVYICGYRTPPSGKPVELWKWGYMQLDAPYPVPMTQAQRDRRRRLRLKGFNPGDLYVDRRKLPSGSDPVHGTTGG